MMTADTSMQQHQQCKPSRRHKKHGKKSHYSSETVLSPHNYTFTPRETIQRTPKKLCTLTLPPPLPSLFDDPSSVETPHPRHKRAPSDLNSIAVSVDPSQITEASHPTPGRYSGAASVSSPDIPPHLRIGMSCDPMIAFDLILVATLDCRIVIYQLMDYDLDFDEDVAASERRRRLEWEEEDINDSDEEEKKSIDDCFVNEEDSDAIERMNRRERSRECVDPLLVISLPINVGSAASEEDDSHSHLQSHSTLPMIVDMCSAPRGVSLIGGRDARSNNIIGHAAVLTDDGRVHVLEFQSSDVITEAGMTGEVDEKDTIYTQLPSVKIICSFRTSCLGATCICMQPLFEEEPRNSNDYISGVKLYIGHECSELECYELNVLGTSLETATSNDNSNLSSPYSLTKSKSNEIPRSNSKNSLSNDSPRRNTSFLSAHLAMDPSDGSADDSFDPSAKLFRTFSEPLDQMAAPAPASRKMQQYSDLIGITVELSWSGSFSAPIRSISCPGWSQSLASIRAQYLLLIGLMQRSSNESRVFGENRSGSKSTNTDLPPAISFEVIDSSLAQQYWSQTKQEINQTDMVDGKTFSVPLNGCSVWPAAGMEIKDRMPREYSTIRQNLGLKSLSVTNKICHFDDYTPCFAFAVSDGTLGISHFNSTGSWGIHHDFNQVILPQKCIGMGALEITPSNSSRYVCCCLRGGTVYLVPVLDQKQMKEPPVTMFSIPVDSSGEDDGLVRYVQNFTAGVANVNCWEDPRNTSLKSVALVGWNGGTIDVYKMSPAEHETCPVMLDRLLETGGVQLIKKLLVVSKSHPLISSPILSDAWDECNKHKDLGCIVTGVKNVSNIDFVSTRTLLMSLVK